MMDFSQCEAEQRCREVTVWLDDARYVDCVARIIAAAMERTPDDLIGIAGGLIATAGAMGGHMDDADRASLAKLMLNSAKRLDGDVARHCNDRGMGQKPQDRGILDRLGGCALDGAGFEILCKGM